MAHWLHLDDPFELLAQAIGPPWEDELESPHRLRAAIAQPRRESCAGWSHHEILECPRTPQDDGAVPCFCVSRFTLSPTAADELNAALCTLAATEASAEDASNVGGYHSSRDLCDWPAARAARLPPMLVSVLEAAAAAAAGLNGGGAASAEPPHEAWLNRLGGGCWNALHTHPGSSFSGVYYADDGGCCHGDALAGRLALVPAAPAKLSSEQQEAHVGTRPSCPPGSTPPTPAAFDYLLIDPVPGTCVVFPSFVPHFVLPVRAAASGGVPAAGDDAGDETSRRVSVAFNAMHRESETS